MARTETRVPTAATALVGLINSRPHATPPLPDTLLGAAAAAEVLAPFGSSDAGDLTPQRLELLRHLRSALTALVDSASPAEAAPSWVRLTEIASPVKLRQAFTEAGEPELRQEGGDPIAGAVVLAVAELLRDGTWSRIRMCANEMCGHAFYDTTRSRTQRWHSYEVCGNRTNVAAYRARKAADVES